MGTQNQQMSRTCGYDRGKSRLLRESRVNTYVEDIGARRSEVSEVTTVVATWIGGRIMKKGEGGINSVQSALAITKPAFSKIG